jgi:4-amino-4-deoxy-L-arabinose transferase-like glycosyltransferase
MGPSGRESVKHEFSEKKDLTSFGIQGSSQAVSRWAHLGPLLLALAAAFGLALLLRSQTAAIPLERDEGEYAYIGQRWLRGEIPYLETFDQKPPGVFVVYAFCLRFIGTSPAAIHWFSQVYTFGTIVCVFLLGRKLFSFTSGACAAVLCTFLATSAGVRGQSANTEIFMILPMSAALVAALKAADQKSVAWSVLVGFLSAGAILFKQVALWNTIFCGLYLLCAGGARRWWLAAGFLLGWAGLLALVLGYFLSVGAWEAFYDCVVRFNLNYAETVPLVDYRHTFWLAFAPILATAWPIYLLASGRLVYGLYRWLGRREVQSARPDLNIIGWLLVSLFGVASGGFFRSHYFVQAIPAVALLAGDAIVGIPLFERIGLRKSIQPYFLCAVIVAAGVHVEAWYYLPGSPEAKCRRLYPQNLFSESVVIARYLAENSTPDDTIFVFGSEPQILYYAERRSATRYILMYPLMLPSDETSARQQSAVEEIIANKPQFVVTVFNRTSFSTSLESQPEPIRTAVLKLLQASYFPEAALLNDGNFVSGPVIGEKWRKHPFWYFRARPEDIWNRVTVWRRNPAKAG